MWILMLLAAIMVVWFLLSIRKVGPTELGVKVIWGSPVAYCKSGPHFVPWFFRWNYLIKVSTQQFKVAIPPVQAYTKSTKVGEEYGSQPLTVDSTIYLTFPKSAKLVDAVRAKIPVTEEGLSEYLKEAVRQAVRIAVGRYTWKTATQDIEKIRAKADKIFHGSDCPLTKAGFQWDDFSLVIEEVRVPQKLEALMSQPEEERFKAEAIKYTTDAQARQTMGLKIKMLAEAYGKTQEEIQQDISSEPGLKEKIDRSSTELIQDIISLEKGALTRIRVDGAEGMDKSILQFIALFKRLGGGEGVKKGPGEQTEEEEWIK